MLGDDPLAALAKLLKFSKPVLADDERIAPSAFVHPKAQLADDVVVGPLAVVEEGAVIGAGSEILARTVVGKNCQIGKQVLLHPSVTVLEGCVVGDHTIIHSGAIIGSDGFGYRVTKQGMQKIPHLGNVVIGKHVEIGAGCCIDRAVFESTTIADGVKLDNLVHIAHNVKIGPHTAIIAQTGIAGSTTIGAGCQIGGQVGIKDHITIGNQVKVVSKSAVLRDLPDGAVVAGIPAIPFRQWKRLMVLFSKFDEFVGPLQALKKLHEKHEGTGGFWKKFMG